MCSLGDCHKKAEAVKRRRDVLVVSQEVETQSQQGDAVRGAEATTSTTTKCERQNREE